MQPFFEPDVALFPAPGSAPLVSGGASPPNVICQSLVTQGLAAEIRPILRRTEAVPKSAYARPGERPSVQRHYETMAVEADLAAPHKILIVGDFITKGATLLAAASRVSEAFPGCEVKAFALIRTMGLIFEIEKTIDPCVGSVLYESGNATRTP